MKLRDKLKISFCVMIVLPVIMLCVFVVGIFKMQSDSICKTYNVEGDMVLLYFYSPMTLFGSITDDVYEQVREQAETEPEKFNNRIYLEELNDTLKEKLSKLVVRKNNNVIYNSTGLSSTELINILPEYEIDGSNIVDVATYKGGSYHSLIKQVDFTDDFGNTYSVSILTSVKQSVPQIRHMIVELIVVIILILAITSLILNLWIYSSIIKPVNKLKLATDNIKEGNFDFEMPKVPDNEIGDVCKDFEEMRLILKKSSEDKLQSDKEEKELIRNISHDLKTPLTAIKGYVEGIRDGVADTPEKMDKYIRVIYNKATDMDRLIDELFLYSKLDSNSMNYSFAKLNLKDYFEDCVDEISLDLESRGIALTYYNHVPENTIIIADPEQLKRVINNIVGNSVKYMGTAPGHIGFFIKDEPEYVQIEIQDNGRGIAKKELPHIFERCYRTDASRNSSKGGSGLGLSIAKKIIEEHGGKIWANSVEGEGTTISFVLRKYKECVTYE